MFGSKMKELRRITGLSITEFAKKVGATPSAISQFEHNKRYPSYETLQKIISTFSISPSALFETKET